MVEKRFTTTIEELERSTHVPLEDQFVEVPEAPADAVLSEATLNQIRTVSVEHNFRW